MKYNCVVRAGRKEEDKEILAVDHNLDYNLTTDIETHGISSNQVTLGPDWNY